MFALSETPLLMIHFDVLEIVFSFSELGLELWVAPCHAFISKKVQFRQKNLDLIPDKLQDPKQDYATQSNAMKQAGFIKRILKMDVQAFLIN